MRAEAAENLTLPFIIGVLGDVLDFGSGGA
jgi:hypothetical protein